MKNVLHYVNSVCNSIMWLVPTCVERNCWLIDCGDVDKVYNAEWKVIGVFITHTHYDHIYGLNRLFELYGGVPIYTNDYGKEALLNPRFNLSRYDDVVDDFVLSHPELVTIVKEGDLIYRADGLSICVLSTPGHDKSSLCYKFANMLFTGDSYIPGLNVVTSFPRSCKLDANISLSRIKKEESEGVIIMPGHKVDY